MFCMHCITNKIVCKDDGSIDNHATSMHVSLCCFIVSLLKLVKRETICEIYVKKVVQYTLVLELLQKRTYERWLKLFFLKLLGSSALYCPNGT